MVLQIPDGENILSATNKAALVSTLSRLPTAPHARSLMLPFAKEDCLFQKTWRNPTENLTPTPCADLVFCVRPLEVAAGNRNKVLCWTSIVFQSLVARLLSKSKWSARRSSSNSADKIPLLKMANSNTASQKNPSQLRSPGVSTGCPHSSSHKKHRLPGPNPVFQTVVVVSISGLLLSSLLSISLLMYISGHVLLVCICKSIPCIALCLLFGWPCTSLHFLCIYSIFPVHAPFNHDSSNRRHAYNPRRSVRASCVTRPCCRFLKCCSL